MPQEQAAVAVLGAGSFGTALAIQLARRGTPTLLWGRDAAAMAVLESERVNARYLPGCRLPPKLLATADLEQAITGSHDVLVSTPSHALREMLHAIKPWLRDRQGVAVACKGFEPGSGRLVHEVVADELSADHPVAVISGPTFAKELGLGLPTAVTVASHNPAFAEVFAAHLHGDGFRAYTSEDVVGVEVGGAVKNVMAIAVGIADGMGLGANTRAMLITRGLAEIRRLGEKLGADPETLIGLSGLGDLVLTCTDNQSRNRRLGLLLAKGRSVAQATAEIEQVVEGVRAAPETLRLAHKHGVDMPITETVHGVLEGRLSPADALRVLAKRPVRAEND
jgi:glycerol-3-phosphate dehydrogenase (NAD(P)+)